MTSPVLPPGLPADTVLDLPAGGFTVGQWAAAVGRAADRIPREIHDGDQWLPNPAAHNARIAARTAFLTACAHLGLPPSQVGPCAGCDAFHHLYGPDGRPLCPTYHAHTHVGRPPGRPRLIVLPGGAADPASRRRTA
ncbi:hypothetical protein [Candidatus Frankia alpina]|uniref:hypothetical protein n=1 Tax=Candidatus Frankia alpina TaxID=2699483 RepID=UPI0013D65EFC|nr:hypothetical protein [Candidatus Frankia alpina]